MITKLDIVLFQKNESYIGDNSLIYELGKDYLLPICIAILAAWIVYFVFLRETKRDKQNEEIKKKNESEDKLLYLSALIDNIIKFSFIQNKFLKEYINKINADDTIFYPLAIVPYNDVTRVSIELNLEEYLLAYTNHYNIDRKASVKEFKLMITSIDILHKHLEQLTETIRTALDHNTKAKSKLEILFKESHSLAGNLMETLRISHIIHYAELEKIYSNFQSNFKDPNDLNYFYNAFFVPVNNFCVDRLHIGMKEIKDLAIATRDSKGLFLQIKSQNQNLKEVILDDQKQISETATELKNIAKKILTDF